MNYLIKPLVILLITFSTIGNFVYAKKTIGVTGQVKDANTKKAIEFCSIIVYNSNDSIIENAVTDIRGFFTTNLKQGKYKLLIEYIGYISDTSEVNIITGNEFLGTFKLEQDNSIDEVVIKGRTENNLIDKDVFLITKELKTGASNTKDVLSKIKGVTYDRYNNSIKVDGEDNIIILVNGLEKDPEYIKNLAPDRLKKIEVIRDPSGRYALEGYSAVINIILKQNYKGYELYLSEHTISDIDNKDKNYLVPIINTSINLNYTYNNVNVYGKYNYNYMNLALFNTSKKEYTSGLGINKNAKDDDNPNMKMKNINDGITIGADYYLNPKHTISFESRINGLAFKDNILQNTAHISYLQNGNLFNEINSKNNNISSNGSSSHSVFYIGKLNKNNTINIDFTYSNNKSNYNNRYFENDVLLRTEIGENNRTNTKFYAEFNHTINLKSNLQIGYGNTTKKLLNSYKIEGIDSDNFEFTDFRNKLYAYYSYRFNEKVGIKIGVAAETSQPKAKNLETTYFIYQPYADIKYKPFKFLDIRFKYRSSSDYPGTSQANPFEYIIDAETVQKGNPALQPAVKHRISTQFKILQGLATIEPYYHFSNNYISKTGFLREDGIFEYNYHNTGNYVHTGVKGNITIPFGKSLFLQTNANFYKSKIEYANKINEFNDWKMNSQLIYVNQKHGTIAGIIFQKNMYKNITAQGYNKWNNDFWGLFAQQDFFKKKLHVMVFYMLPISLGIDYSQGSYVKTDSYTELNIQDMHILQNVFMLQLSYRLNKGKSVRKTKKIFKLEEKKTSKEGIF